MSEPLKERLMDITTCPDREKLSGYVVGTIAEQEAAAVAAHLEQCSSCQRTVEELEGLSDPMLSALRQPADAAQYGNEPACRHVLEKLRAARSDPPDATHAKARVARTKESRRAIRLGDYELLKRLGQGGWARFTRPATCGLSGWWP